MKIGAGMKRYEESDAHRVGKSGGTFYAQDLVSAREQRRLTADAPHIIRVEDQVWEDSPQGRLKHISHEKLSPHVTAVDAYIQELPPDGRSGKHRHMAEEFIFFLEGHGYSLHWDIDLAEWQDAFSWRAADVPQRFEWEAGDWMYIPANTIHQHFNADGEEPARFLSATSTIYKFLGWHDLEQLEDAPPPGR
jgi:quercetin dioxygenase-like cupin family protein